MDKLSHSEVLLLQIGVDVELVLQVAIPEVLLLFQVLLRLVGSLSL